MSDKIDHSGKNIAVQRGPYAAPCVTGISPDVLADLAKLGSEKSRRIIEVVKRKNT